MSDRFRAVVLEQEDGATRASVRELSTGDLPQGDVLVEVAYSTLNYKDGLAITGKGPVVRRFPMVPGIDLSGRVLESSRDAFRPGDEVLLTGFGVGERHWGGLAQRARLEAAWLVRLPDGLDLQQAMAIGTAGFTAMLAVMALEEAGLAPDGAPEVVVTGAAGGLGSIAVALLAARGYKVLASTGRPEHHDYLRELGAAEIVERAAFAEGSPRPLESARFAGAVDTVGGDTLANLLKSMARGGAVAACGNAGGAELHTTVFPFILRGVRLLGIDSVECPMPRREAAWQRLARELPKDLLARITEVRPLALVPALAEAIVEGRIRGRTVIDVNA
jgi:acrylyl-CoA reductase (NADPH)